jgi:hypothetical protein
MMPYYERDGITIYHGDCRDILPTLPPVDLVLTDPPYGVDIAEWDATVPYDLVPTFLDISMGAVVWFGASPMLQTDLSQFAVKPDRTLIWAPSFTLLHTQANGLAYRWHPIHTWRIPKKHDGPKWDLLTTPTECGNWWRHDCTKPLKLIRQLAGFAPQNGLILDPFMGSGTTLRAAMDLGRKAIGIEIEERCCEIAVRRLQQQVLALDIPA